MDSMVFAIASLKPVTPISLISICLISIFKVIQKNAYI